MDKGGSASRALRKEAQATLRHDLMGRNIMALARAEELVAKHPHSALVLHLAALIHHNASRRSSEAGELAETARHLKSSKGFLAQARRLEPNCIKIRVLLSKVLFEESKHKNHRLSIIEVCRALELRFPVDPAENDARYGIDGSNLRYSTDDINNRIDECRAWASTSLDGLVRWVCRYHVPDAVRELLDIAQREVGPEAIKMASELAKTYFYSCRAQNLSVYMGVRFARGLGADVDKKTVLLGLHGDMKNAAVIFSTSIVLAMLRAKVCFVLGLYEDAEKQCRRTLETEKPDDPGYDDVPPGSIHGEEEYDRVSTVHRELKRLLLKIGSVKDGEVDSFDDAIDAMFPDEHIDVAQDGKDPNAAKENVEIGSCDCSAEEMASSSNFQRSVNVLKQNNADKDILFLHLIIQSLWNLRHFRDEFLRAPDACIPSIVNPCISDIIGEIFSGWEKNEYHKTTELLVSLKTILLTMVDDSKTFGQGGKNYASVIVQMILIQLHMSETASHFGFNRQTERQVANPITCGDCTCPIHNIFGIKFDAKMRCGCGNCSDENRYTALFHLLDTGSLQTTKIKSFSKLPVILDEQFHEDHKCENCGIWNDIDLFVSNTPHFFTIVLKWQGGSKGQITLSKVLAGIKSSLDVKFFCKGVDSATKYNLASMICYVDERPVCISRDQEKWHIYDYDSKSVETEDTWKHLRERFRDYKLQPEVLFFEIIT